MAEALRLSELAGLVRSVIEDALSADYWVAAEVAQVNVNRRSGHCYLELVEKEDSELLAQMRATIWNRQYAKLASEFEKVTGSPITAGMSVLLRVGFNFHEVYGLSLNVREIDPGYTLGEMARARRETIERLTKEGIMDANRSLPMPLVPLRVAVISSETAAGLGDFLKTLAASGYAFKVALYPAFMQGAKAEASITAALRACASNASEYDIAALIRGGGSQAELSCFDSYALSRAIALMPMPVLIGIGHERDESVADLVAHTRLITPTAVAGHIVGMVESFESEVLELGRRLQARTLSVMDAERQGLLHRARMMATLGRGMLSEQAQRLDAAGREMRASLRYFYARSAAALDTTEARLRLLDPINVMKRGFSITTFGGRALTDAGQLNKGARVLTRLYKGEFTSTVEDIIEERKDGQEEGADICRGSRGA